LFPDIPNALLPELPSHFGVQQQISDGFGHGLSIIVSDQEAGLSVDHDLRNARRIEGNHRQSTRLRLQVDHSKGFSDAGKGEKICGRVVLCHIMASHSSGKECLAGQKLCRLGPEVFLHGAVSDHEKDHFAVLVSEQGKASEKVDQAFAFDPRAESGGGHDDGSTLRNPILLSDPAAGRHIFTEFFRNDPGRQVENLFRRKGSTQCFNVVEIVCESTGSGF